tara:strand:- start:1816 stop:2091 length:276 start_codon:yes stop_codon:yes gene_type:complete
LLGGKKMLIEKIEAASFTNNLLRVQTSKVGADGKMLANDTIEIPGNLVGEVINGLVSVSQDISNKIGSGEETKKDSPKKTSKSTKKNKKTN